MTDRISVDPLVCSGKPCVRGTRIMVKNILGMFAGGYDIPRVLAAYPELTADDVAAALEQEHSDKICPRPLRLARISIDPPSPGSVECRSWHPRREAMSIDLDRLLRLRLVVARFGEMDVAKWWNTKGQLGRLGATALRRGFPRTHHFAQARSVFAVAAHRCEDRFNPPGSVTLWRLPAAIDEEFDARWEHWLDHAPDWQPFFQKLESVSGSDLVATLRSFELVGDDDVQAGSRLRRSAEDRAVPLPGIFTATDRDVALLALGFARGEVGALAVPYAHREER